MEMEMCIFIVQYPREFSRLHNLHSWYWNSCIQSHLLWGEFSICALCSSNSGSLQFSFLVPPGTHHCWVNRDGMIWEVCLTPLHMASSVMPSKVLSIKPSFLLKKTAHILVQIHHVNEDGIYLEFQPNWGSNTLFLDHEYLFLAY